MDQDKSDKKSTKTKNMLKATEASQKYKSAD